MPFGKAVFCLFKAINEISAAAADARCRLSLSVRQSVYFECRRLR
ncbi:hypothetical protein NLA_9440 [Neisseria lactamica 020-06]|uniref:Uncharacterized protein n=1 Tax=Neisseria lactamica (strain 020-06) TaxID=489653 RepID=E4ZCT8_NEIL0|nr:hypothetical protein NLA_9440 [Neisseria lactamica 020-06]